MPQAERHTDVFSSRISKAAAGMEKLKKILLGHGGSRVCMPAFEEDLKSLLTQGRLWRDPQVIFMPGRPSHCHQNACRCWYANQKESAIATGYALSDDGIWRQHSWLVQNSGTLIETTESRCVYFGIVMSPERSMQFYADND